MNRTVLLHVSELAVSLVINYLNNIDLLILKFESILYMYIVHCIRTYTTCMGVLAKYFHVHCACI